MPPQPQTAPATAATKDSSTAADTADTESESDNGSSAGSAAHANGERSDENLPQLELSSDILVQDLSAEIAYQRGDWQYAYVTLLGLAQQTRDPRLARRASEIALASKRAGEALAAIRLWHELAPDSEQAMQYYLSFIVLSDKLDEAQPIFARRLQQAEADKRGAIMLQIQRTLARARNKAAVLPMLETLVAPYATLPEAHLALARAAFDAGQGELALQHAHLALRARPDSELAILTLAQVAPDQASAAQALAGFVAAHPKAREARIAYARVLVEQKQYQAARDQFVALLKSDARDLSTLFALGTLSAELNDYSTAERYLTSYIEILAAQPDDARDPTPALLLLAQIAQDRNDTERALQWLAQIEPGPAYIGAQIKRAQLVAAQGGIEHAQKMLAEISTDGEREETQVLLAQAQILRDAGRVPQAQQLLKSALQRMPDNVDLLYDYAMLAEKQNELDLMETTLRKLIQLAPNNQHAYNALGYSLAERNIRLPEARELIQKALSFAPEDPFISDSLGWVQYRLGNLQAAEDYLRRAYTQQPDTEIGVHLGEVLWVRGQRSAAEQLWRVARSKDPHNSTLKNTLTRLQAPL